MYSEEDDFARRRGYDDFNTFSESNEIPSLIGLSGAQIQANTLVNMAYNNTATDTTNSNHTSYMKEMELLVIERILDNGRARDQKDWKVPIRPLLTEQELYNLSVLGGKRKVFTVKTID